MKGRQKVIQHLNIIPGAIELVAINRYFCTARMLQELGLNKMGDHEYHESSMK